MYMSDSSSDEDNLIPNQDESLLSIGDDLDANDGFQERQTNLSNKEVSTSPKMFNVCENSTRATEIGNMTRNATEEIEEQTVTELERCCSANEEADEEKQSLCSSSADSSTSVVSNILFSNERLIFKYPDGTYSYAFKC